MDIIGVDHNNKSFFVAFTFLPDQSEGSYRWAIAEIKGLFTIISHVIGLNPGSISTDCDQALRNAISRIFSESANYYAFGMLIRISSSTARPNLPVLKSLYGPLWMYLRLRLACHVHTELTIFEWLECLYYLVIFMHIGTGTGIQTFQTRYLSHCVLSAE
jgi:hypothetical protein